MKNVKQIFAGLLPVAYGLLLSACSSNTDFAEQQSVVKKIPYVVTVGGNDGVTRSEAIDMDDAESVTRANIGDDLKTLLFSTGDRLYVEGTDISGVLELTEGEGTASATFSGELNYTGLGTPADNLELTATLVGTMNENLKLTQDNVTGGWTLADNGYGSAVIGNTAAVAVSNTVPLYSKLVGTGTYSGHTFQLKQQTAFLNFAISLDDGTVGPTNSLVGLSGVGEEAHFGIVNCWPANSENNSLDKPALYFCVPVAAGTTLSDAKVFVNDNGGIAFGAGVTLKGKVYNVSKTSTGSDNTSIEYIDLGLSVRWCNMNQSAGRVSGYGTFFHWGSTNPSQGKFTQAKDAHYDTTTSSYKKYNATDGKTVLDDEDNIIRKYQSTCDMPTTDQLTELKNGCVWALIQNYKGKNRVGYMAMSKQPGHVGTAIFFPCAGYKIGSTVNNQNNAETPCIQIWTKNLGSDITKAWHSDSQYSEDYYLFATELRSRSDGLPVRGVCALGVTQPTQPSTTAAGLDDSSGDIAL